MMTRRIFGILSTAALAACRTGTPEQGLFKVEVEHKAMTELFASNPETQILGTGYQWSEGPVWIAETQTLYFTDVPQNKAYAWTQATGTKLFLSPSGADVEGFREPGANGLFYDYQSRLLLCNHGTRSVEVLNLETLERTTLADRFEGQKFNSPNDVVATRGGDIFFTDPPYGLKDLDASPLKEQSFNGVYHLAKDGTVKVLDTSLTFPNGIALSPDARSLYVSQSDPKKPVIIRYALDEDFAVVERELFYDFSETVGPDAPGLPDGMTVDVSGNIFTTGPGGIHVIDPAGTLLGSLILDRASSNCTFGADGKLFITNQDRILSVQTKTTGLREA